MMILGADTVKYKYGSFLLFIVMYTSHESWINKSEMYLFVNLESEGVQKSQYWENHL